MRPVGKWALGCCEVSGPCAETYAAITSRINPLDGGTLTIDEVFVKCLKLLRILVYLVLT